MKAIFYFLIALIFTGIFTGCATLLSGTTDQVTFRSNPPGAKVLINGKEVGTTNNSITLKRKECKNAAVTYQKEGYHDLSFPYETKIATAYWGSIALFLAGVVPGAAASFIDLWTGAAVKSKYDTYEKTLVPLQNK